MEKNLTIIDKDYLQWVKDLALRYRQSQIKAAVKVNQEALMFYLLYSGLLITPQLGEQIGTREISPQLGTKYHLTSSPFLGDTTNS